MKRLLLCGFLLSCLHLSAQSTSSPTADEGKAYAAQIKDQVSALKSGQAAPEAWVAVDAKIAAYQKDYGNLPHTPYNISLLRKLELSIAKKVDPARYQSLLKTLQTDPLQPVADMAREVQATDERIANLKTKPLELKFTSVDGQVIDIAQLRGKVVLVDFWATWCPPCVEEVPNVVATFHKFHDQGFEILGISLDQDKSALTSFTQARGMTWPQYFDGQVWQNKISSSYGIQSIPAMWLIDKKGMLVTTDGRTDLAGQIEKLLAAP